MKNSDYIIVISLFLFSFLMWFLIIPNEVPGKNEAIFPKIIILWIFVSNCILFFQCKNIKGTKNNYSIGYFFSKQVFILFFIFIFYIFLINLIGFFPSSFLFLITIMVFLEVRDYKKIILIDVVFLMSIYLVIEKVFSFRLPHGIFF